jgi:hypothetical protein
MSAMSARRSTMDAGWALVRLGGWTHHFEALRARDAHAGPFRLAEGLGPSGPAGDPGRMAKSWGFSGVSCGTPEIIPK